MATFGQQLGGIPRAQWGKALKRVFDYLDYKTTAGATRLGSAPTITGMVCTEAGAHCMRETTFTFTDTAIAMVDEAGVVAYKGTKIYDFPAGNILVLGATADLVLKKSSAGIIDAWDGDFGLGTVTASNNATLSSTEQNIIPTTATPQATGVGAAATTTAKGINAAAIAPLDGTATAIDLYLNFLIDDTDHDVTGTPANLIVSSGTVKVYWINLGDK